MLPPAAAELPSGHGLLYYSVDTTLHCRCPLAPPAIEAPFIVRKDKHFYLFVSFDMCCRGKDSTYKTMVGRAERITGPYIDKDGRPMAQDGGTLLLEGMGTTGRPTLQISTMVWEAGWPRVGRLR